MAGNNSVGNLSDLILTIYTTDIKLTVQPVTDFGRTCHREYLFREARREQKFVFLAIITALPLTGAYIISLARADMQKLAELAANTQITELKSSLNGMAWVQTRFGPVASETFLVCSDYAVHNSADGQGFVKQPELLAFSE